MRSITPQALNSSLSECLVVSLWHVMFSFCFTLRAGHPLIHTRFHHTSFTSVHPILLLLLLFPILVLLLGNTSISGLHHEATRSAQTPVTAKSQSSLREATLTTLNFTSSRWIYNLKCDSERLYWCWLHDSKCDDAKLSVGHSVLVQISMVLKSREFSVGERKRIHADQPQRRNHLLNIVHSQNSSDLSKHGHNDSGFVLWCLAPGYFLWILWTPWIRLVPAHSKDARSDWDLGNLGARLTPWALCFNHQGVPEQFLWCVRVHFPAGVAAAYPGVLIPNGNIAL